MKSSIKLCILLCAFLFCFYLLFTPSLAFSPSSSNIYEGIDVSDWQGFIDYSQVAASGIQIVYIRSSEGFSYVDSQFENNYKNAKAAGLTVGFYHYLTARTVEDAVNQATFFVSTISGKSPDCKLAMDFESFGNLNNEQINEISLAFLEKVKELSGKEPIIYSNEYNANNTFSSTVASYPLWVAQYEVSNPTVSQNWNTWVGWQYTDQGEIPGISAYVDRNKFTDGVLLEDNSEVPNVPNNPVPSQYITITIPYGATLTRIAEQYNTTVANLVSLNNISNPNLIYAGNTLIVPSNGTSSSSTIQYVVKRGDTLSQIALDFGTTVTAIANENNIYNVNFIYVGQILYISTSTSQHCMNHTLYVVKYGDTLWGISRRFGVSIARLIMLNRIVNPNLIYPGNVLRL